MPAREACGKCDRKGQIIDATIATASCTAGARCRLAAFDILELHRLRGVAGPQIEWCPRPSRPHIMVTLIVQDLGGQEGHGRMADVLLRKRRGAGLSCDLARPVHDRHRAIAGEFAAIDC